MREVGGDIFNVAHLAAEAEEDEDRSMRNHTARPAASSVVF
jgi:hypothetical protein